MQIHRFLGGDSLGEIFAGRHLADGHLARQVENIEEAPFREPIAVLVDLGLAQVDDPADLGEIVDGVGLDLILGQLGARLVAARGVADQGGVVADNDDRRMAQFLKLAQFPQGDGVSEVNIDTGGIDAVLDAKRAVFADRPVELFEEFGFRDDLVDSALQDRKLFGDVPHWAIKLHGDFDVGDSERGPGEGASGLSEFADSRARCQSRQGGRSRLVRVRSTVQARIPLGPCKEPLAPCPISDLPRSSSLS